MKRDDAPSIAILDWMMPRMDGAQVCAKIRQETGKPYIYIILLTARNQKGDAVEGLKSGADDYVVKPFDGNELRARLRVAERVVALERKLALKVTALQTALADVKKLKQLLPICTYCKSIRDDKDYWRHIEEYIHNETGSDFSHGICPKCMDRVMAELERNQD